jgi:hypothetical protein
VWTRRSGYCRGPQQFFYVAFGYDSLANHYNINFSLMQHHKYSLSDLENMIPFERQIYVAYLVAYLEEERLKLEQKQ